MFSAINVILKYSRSRPIQFRKNVETFLICALSSLLWCPGWSLFYSHTMFLRFWEELMFFKLWHVNSSILSGEQKIEVFLICALSLPLWCTAWPLLYTYAALLRFIFLNSQMSHKIPSFRRGDKKVVQNMYNMYKKKQNTLNALRKIKISRSANFIKLKFLNSYQNLKLVTI